MNKLQSYCPKKCCVKWSSMSREKDKNAKPRKSHGKRLIRQSCGRRRALYSGELKGFDIFALFFINSLSHQWNFDSFSNTWISNFGERSWPTFKLFTLKCASKSTYANTINSALKAPPPPPQRQAPKHTDSLWTQVICVLFEYMHSYTYMYI